MKRDDLTKKNTSRCKKRRKKHLVGEGEEGKTKYQHKDALAITMHAIRINQGNVKKPTKTKSNRYKAKNGEEA